MKATPDFSGWATRHNVKCSDGLTIVGGAFSHNDGNRVPLVWSHDHSSPENVLGHAELENRPEGVYAYGYFNDTDMGTKARDLVAHGDIDSLSIYANRLVKRGDEVLHGQIRELSLVLSGANPEARIEQVNIRHSDDGSDELEGIVYSGDLLMHKSSDEFVTETPEEPSEEKEAQVATNEPTVQDVIDTMDEDQKNVMYYLIGQAAEDNAAPATEEDFDDEDLDDEELAQSGLYTDDYLAHEGFNDMTGNVFEQGADFGGPEPILAHSDIEEIVNSARRNGSLKDSFLAHAEQYGIENIDILFPNAKSLTGPEFLKRQTEWVTDVLNGVHKSPFARIKSVVADITADEARARGYIKGKEKKDEVIKLLKRETTPTTVYKKQKLDRDDVVDITDLDVVAWLKGEMKLMLNEEIAAAIIVGDGRETDSEDKIKEESIRPITKDVFPYTHTAAATKESGYGELIKQIIRSRKNYKGSGIPQLYIDQDAVTEMLLLEDKFGRAIYDDIEKLKTKLRVSKIVEIPSQIFKRAGDVFGVMVNLNDYTIGSDRGGETTMFEDFDIDFNQQKYLIETRLSGCLTKPESAIILKWGTPSEEEPKADPNNDGVIGN